MNQLSQPNKTIVIPMELDTLKKIKKAIEEITIKIDRHDYQTS